jgi:hypothetical protein
LGSFKKPSGDKLDWNVLRSSSVKQNRWVCWLMYFIEIKLGLVLFQAPSFDVCICGSIRSFSVRFDFSDVWGV